MSAFKVLVSTIPFGEKDPTPIRLLADAGCELVINPLGRKLQGEELGDIIAGMDGLVAGTETINDRVMARADKLKVIARVGIGLDSVDLLAARRRGIALAYTPDGPSPAVAELAVGLTLDLLRGVNIADRKLRDGVWGRYMGRRLNNVTVGLVGMGRIGTMVARHLRGGFPGVRILANDLQPKANLADELGVTWVDKATLYKEADVISLHVPLGKPTRGLIGAAELAAMKPDALLINTARGGIVDEAALADALRRKVIAGAAIDVFEIEPYKGELAKLDNCIVTCHMGSMSEDCRARMEIEAVEEVVRFAKGQPFLNPVPEAEYAMAAEG